MSILSSYNSCGIAMFLAYVLIMLAHPKNLIYLSHGHFKLWAHTCRVIDWYKQVCLLLSCFKLISLQYEGETLTLPKCMALLSILLCSPHITVNPILTIPCVILRCFWTLMMLPLKVDSLLSLGVSPSLKARLPWPNLKNLPSHLLPALFLSSLSPVP